MRAVDVGCSAPLRTPHRRPSPSSQGPPRSAAPPASFQDMITRNGVHQSMAYRRINVRVRFQIIGNLETKHDWDLPTFLMRALPIIWKRTRISFICLCFKWMVLEQIPMPFESIPDMRGEWAGHRHGALWAADIIRILPCLEEIQPLRSLDILLHQ